MARSTSVRAARQSKLAATAWTGSHDKAATHSEAARRPARGRGIEIMSVVILSVVVMRQAL
ncbi:hypothetical protein [Burkholderia ubonensis]|uniref:hypothetical protein n=1 Tax=Burkholderia ubonensis TaxID=101571 RepID=UPI0012FA7A20|nr:hypothetical protein [Burkholderia ubonensis]